MLAIDNRRCAACTVDNRSNTQCGISADGARWVTEFENSASDVNRMYV
jgi:hypothetical protein